MTPVHDSVATAKAVLRKHMLARRDALDAATRIALSARITECLLKLDSYRAADSVLAYMSIGSEFDTRALLEQMLAQGKTLWLPRIERATRRLSLHVVRDLKRDLLPGVWGIPQPRPELDETNQLHDFKWILVPGLAFTAQGDRLGYGAGYYDRLIAACSHKPLLVAAAFGIQIVDAMPLTTNDQRMDCVVTEAARYPL